MFDDPDQNLSNRSKRRERRKKFLFPLCCLCFLLFNSWDLSAQPVIQTTRYTRGLLIQVDAPSARAYLGISGTNGLGGTNYLFNTNLFRIVGTNVTLQDPLVLTNVLLVGGIQGLNWDTNYFAINNGTNFTFQPAMTLSNITLAANTQVPVVGLGSISGTTNIDASTGSEFSVTLAGDLTIGFTPWNDNHPVNVRVSNTGNFSITFTNIMYWIPNGNSTQITNDWGAGITDVFHFFKDAGVIYASDKEGAGTSSAGVSGGGVAGQSAFWSSALTLTGDTNVVENIAALKLQNAGANPIRFVKGYYTADDGGGGIFVLTNTATATNGGTRFQIAATTNSWERLHGSQIDVKWFGAVGNGVADDTQSITNAFQFAFTNNFAVLLSRGTFKTTARIDIPSNAQVVGMGRNSVIFAVLSNIAINIVATNVLLRDFSIGGTNVVGIYTSGGSDITLERMEVYGSTVAATVTAGIVIDGTASVKILYPYLHHNGVAGTNQVADYNILVNFSSVPSRDLLIQSPLIINQNSKYGIAIFCQSDARVIDPYIDMNNMGGPQGNNGYGLMSYGNVGNANTRVSFIGGTVTNTYGTGVYVNNTIDGEVIGMHISNSSQVMSDTTLVAGGIGVNASKDIRLLGNSVTNTGLSSGITLASTTNTVVFGNNISTPGANKWGIWLRGYNDSPSIMGNTILNADRGIGTSIDTSDWVSGADIDGNVIRTPGYGVVLSATSSNSIIRANRIYGNTIYGILEQGLNNTIDNNIVVGGANGMQLSGTNGIVQGNFVAGQTTGVIISGAGYRFDDYNRIENNTTPIVDSGGSLVRTITTGQNPSIRDTRTFYLSYASPTTITNLAGGLLGDRRTFLASNTNTTFAANTTLLLDGAHDVNMKSGDTLTLQLDTGNVWRQVGKSINASWQWYDRVAEQLNFGVPTFQETLPSASVYPEDHIISNTNTANALMARWWARGLPVGFVITTSADKTNYVFQYNGIGYVYPMTNGAAGQVLTSDGAAIQKLSWSTPSSGATFSGVANGVVFSPNGSSLTNGTNIYIAGGSQLHAFGLFPLEVENSSTADNIVFDGSGLTLNPYTSTDTYIELPVGAGHGLSFRFAGENPIFRLKANHNILMGDSSVTNVGRSTNFVYIETTTGTPTGTPAADGGVALTYDTVGHALWAYDGAWRNVGMGTNALALPVSIANGGTGTNSMGTQIGVIPFLTASTNVLGSSADLQWVLSPRYLLVTHQTTTTQPFFVAMNADTVSSASLFADRLYSTGTGADFIIDRAVGTGGTVFTNNLFRTLRLTPEGSAVVSDGTTTTTRTNKFFYLPTTAGAPTGVPKTETGTVAMAYDTTGSHLNVYSGAAWNQIDGSTNYNFSGLPLTNVVQSTDTIAVTTDGGSNTMKVSVSDLTGRSEQDLGTIVGAGTATFSNSTNLYRAVFSGSTFNLNLPASPSTGAYVQVIGTNTSGVTQISTIQVAGVTTPLWRESLNLSTSTITNNQASAFTIQFRASNGQWSRVDVQGDAPINDGWLASNTNSYTLSNVAIGTTPVIGQKLTILATNSNDGVFLTNGIPATSGIPVENSPALSFAGNAWLTASLSNAPIVMKNYFLPAFGTTLPLGNLVWEVSLNNAAYTTSMTLSPAGALTLTSVTASQSVQAGPTANFNIQGRSMWNSSANGAAEFNNFTGTLRSTIQANIPQIAKTSNYTNQVALDSGLRITNLGASGAVTNFLPTAVALQHYWGYVDAAQILSLKCASGDVLHNGAASTSSGGDIWSSTQYSVIHFFAPKAGHWVVDSLIGTWAQN